MALHMSIGLLFLGGGRASLSRSKEAIAALLLALFPRFPQSTEDNQYHLQPLRHLWVLAVSWRGFKAIDAETGKDTCLPLEIKLSKQVDYELTRYHCAEGSSAPRAGMARKMAPCLLPPLEDVCSIRVT